MSQLPEKIIKLPNLEELKKQPSGKRINFSADVSRKPLLDIDIKFPKLNVGIKAPNLNPSLGVNIPNINLSVKGKKEGEKEDEEILTQDRPLLLLKKILGEPVDAPIQIRKKPLYKPSITVNRAGKFKKGVPGVNINVEGPRLRGPNVNLDIKTPNLPGVNLHGPNIEIKMPMFDIEGVH